MTADGLQLAACGPDENEIRIIEDLPKATRVLGMRTDSTIAGEWRTG